MKSRKRWQDFIFGFLAAITVFCVANTAALAESAMKTIEVFTGVRVYVNDLPIDSGDLNGNPDAFVYNGTTYIPVRAVSNSLNQAVLWDNETKSVYVGKHDNSVQAKESTSKITDISQYLYHDIYDTLPAFDNMTDTGASDGTTEYGNGSVIISSGWGDNEIDFILITSECEYSLFGIKVGMNLSDAIAIAKSVGKEISSRRSDIFEYQLDTGEKLSIYTDDWHTVSQVNIFGDEK